MTFSLQRTEKNFCFLLLVEASSQSSQGPTEVLSGTQPETRPMKDLAPQRLLALRGKVEGSVDSLSSTYLSKSVHTSPRVIVSLLRIF